MTGTEHLDLDNVETHGEPLRLSEEIPGELPKEPVAKTPIKAGPPKPIRAVGDGKPARDDAKPKLAVVAAVAAAGIAIALGVRHFRSEEPNTADSGQLRLKHKAKEAKHDAKHEAKKVVDKGENVLENLGSTVSSAASKVGEKSKHALGDIPDKAQLREEKEEVKEAIEEYTEEADKRAASPGAELEQRRMTYGEDKHGVPKGLTEDAGFLGYKNWFPFGQKKQ